MKIVLNGGDSACPPTPPLRSGRLLVLPVRKISDRNFKSLHYILASMTEAEPLRLLLQNKFDRIENLVQMNHAATLAVPSVLAAIWGISLKENGFEVTPILCFISIGLLLVWRYFAHYLDRDIAKTYIDVVKIENRLGVPRELSLFNNFIESLTEEMGKNENKKVELFEKNIKKIDDVERIKFLKGLYKKSKMGYRGHKKWDWVAMSFIFIFLIGSLFSRIIYHFMIFRIVYSLVFLVLILLTIIVFTSSNIQKDPEIPKDLDEM